MSAKDRAQTFRTLQQTYGNRYVQMFVSGAGQSQERPASVAPHKNEKTASYDVSFDISSNVSADKNEIDLITIEITRDNNEMIHNGFD